MPFENPISYIRQQQQRATGTLAHIRAVQSLLPVYHQAASDIRDAEVQAAAHIRDTEIMAADRARHHELATQESQFQASLSVADNEFAALVKANSFHLVPWTSPRWSTHQQPTAGLPPASLRIGRIDLADYPELESAHITMPALIPIQGAASHLLLNYVSVSQSTAMAALESLVWRIVAQTAPGTYEFILIDGGGLGNNFAPLQRLPEAIRGHHILHDEEEIHLALKRLNTDIGEVIQSRLGHRYSSIAEYNQANPNVRVPYRYLVIADYPHHFSAAASELLNNLATNGAAAGLTVLAGHNTQSPAPYGSTLAGLQSKATVLTTGPNGTLRGTLPGTTSRTITMTPDSPPNDALKGKLAMVKMPDTSIVDFETFQRQTIPEPWKGSTIDKLAVPIGLGPDGKPYVWQLDKSEDDRHVANPSIHGLVGGEVGSGKSNYLHTLILQLCRKYSPEEFQLYLIDFKLGAEFQFYKDLPHVRVLAMEAHAKAAVALLHQLLAEYRRRNTIFTQHGVSNYKEYRRLPQRTEAMPRLLLIIDEFKLLLERDRDGAAAGDALAELALGARSASIHILLCGQTLTPGLPRMTDIKNQSTSRVAFKLSADQSTYFLGDRNTAASVLPDRGFAAVTTDPEDRSRTVQVRVPKILPNYAQTQVTQFRAAWNQRASTTATPLSRPVVLNYDLPASWMAAPLTKSTGLRPTPWQPAAEPTFWLGESAALGRNPVIRLPQDAQQNVLIVTPDADQAHGILLSAMLGLWMTTKPQPGTSMLWLLPPSTHHEAGKRLSSFMHQAPHQSTVPHSRERVSQLGNVLDFIVFRKEQVEEQDFPRYFVMLPRPDTWADLKQGDPSDPDHPAQQLLRLFQDGPAVGVHSIVWTDSLDRLASLLDIQYDLNPLTRPFAHRILAGCSDADAETLAADPLAGNPDPFGKGRLVSYRDTNEHPRTVHVFKPYSVLPADRLQGVLRTIADKWGQPEPVQEVTTHAHQG